MTETLNTIRTIDISELADGPITVETFRSASFATAELFDPLEATEPFRRCDLLSIIEEEWCFRRDAVPEWITLKTGRAAREQLIEGLKEEYGLDPAMRFKRLEGSARA